MKVASPTEGLACTICRYWQKRLAGMPVNYYYSLLSAGIAGGAGPNHSLANSGTTVAEIYNVSQPVGQRWSTVADSQIQRLYHSIAFLTPNATVSPCCCVVLAPLPPPLFTPQIRLPSIPDMHVSTAQLLFVIWAIQWLLF